MEQTDPFLELGRQDSSTIWRRGGGRRNKEMLGYWYIWKKSEEQAFAKIFSKLVRKLFEIMFFEPGWRGKLISEIDLIAAMFSIKFSSISNFYRNRSYPRDFPAV